MILQTFTEEEILNELIADYNIVKRKVKNIARDYLDKAQKKGKYIRESEYSTYDLVTSRKNKWFIEIEYNQTIKTPWVFRACCIVEGEKNNKEYYILRGLNTDKPYFVKVTSHTMKRINERKNYNLDPSYMKFLACRIFVHRETAICMKFIDIKYHNILAQLEITDNMEDPEDTSHIVLTEHGVYYAYKTALGNYIFKTFITNLTGLQEAINSLKNKYTKWQKEGELITTMILIHMYYNKSLYDKKTLDNMLYRFLDKDTEYDFDNVSGLYLLKH